MPRLICAFLPFTSFFFSFLSLSFILFFIPLSIPLSFSFSLFFWDGFWSALYFVLEQPCLSFLSSCVYRWGLLIYALVCVGFTRVYVNIFSTSSISNSSSSGGSSYLSWNASKHVLIPLALFPFFFLLFRFFLLSSCITIDLCIIGLGMLVPIITMVDVGGNDQTW